MAKYIHKIIYLALLFICITISSASSQVIQDTTNAITIGRAAKQLGVNLIGDAGAALGGPPGSGLTELGITNSSNCGLGITTGPITVGYRQLCFGYDGSGNALITVVSNGLANTNLNFNINNATYTFPGNGQGNILGPNSSVINNGVCWNNTIGTLVKDCGFPPVLGPNTSVVGHVPIYNNVTGNLLADPTGATKSLLLSASSNYVATTSYGATTNNAMILGVLGSSGAPDSTQDALIIAQKHSNSTSASGINTTAYFSHYKRTSAAGSHVVSVFAESQDMIGDGVSSFVEGGRFHGILSSSGSNAYGTISVAGAQAGVTHNILAASEIEVDKSGITDDPAIFDLNAPFSVGYLASCGAANTGFNKCGAVLASNGFVTPWKNGFVVTPNSLDTNGTVVAIQQIVGTGLDCAQVKGGVALGNPTYCVLAPNNEIAVGAWKADNSAIMMLIGAGSSNQVLIAPDANAVQISMGSQATPTKMIGPLDFLQMTAPSAPVAGQYRMYMDSADGKLKVKSSAGTTTTIGP